MDAPVANSSQGSCTSRPRRFWLQPSLYLSARAHCSVIPAKAGIQRGAIAIPQDAAGTVAVTEVRPSANPGEAAADPGRRSCHHH